MTKSYQHFWLWIIAENSVYLYKNSITQYTAHWIKKRGMENISLHTYIYIYLSIHTSPLASCCVWCRTAGVSGCSPCCGSPAAVWSAGTSAWPGPLGRRWPELPPEGPWPPAGVWGTRPVRHRGGAWCAWRPPPPPPPTCARGKAQLVKSAMRPFWTLLEWVFIYYCGQKKYLLRLCQYPASLTESRERSQHEKVLFIFQQTAPKPKWPFLERFKWSQYIKREVKM